MSHQPARGDDDAYGRYLAAMDAAMAQKIAVTAAHLLGRGTVADMGMGSGAGSDALAALYPDLQVVGVDLDPEMVERARSKFQRPNLKFVTGDIAANVFPPESLDAIFNSSVLHHVTSFSGYDPHAAARAIAVQANQLRLGGVVIVRDFLSPTEDRVWLDLPDNDGDASDDPRNCSSARLLLRFSGEFRPLSSARGFSLREITDGPPPPLRKDWRRFELNAKHAAELLLRKDYRADWEREVLEEYTYFTRDEMEQCFARLGLRILASTPMQNPWIVRNRFQGKVELRAAGGEPVELPATNYIIVGEKVAPEDGVRFRVKAERPPQGFLERTFYRDQGSGHVMDLVRRPHRTLDFVPFFTDQGALFVLARGSYPRPILSLAEANCPGLRVAGPLDGARAPQYVTEPLNVIETDKPVAQTIEESLQGRAGISPDSIKRFLRGPSYYPSPGGIQEEIASSWVQIEPQFISKPLDGLSGFSTSGHVAAIDAKQVLRAAEVGALPDARLEINVYGLLAELGRSPGPWIGEMIELVDRDPPANPRTLAELTAVPSRRVFRRVDAEQSRGFLTHAGIDFEELSASGRAVASRALELVLPRPFSTNTVVAAPLRRARGEVWLGLHDRDLPAAQCFEGSSQLFVAPAWRVPHEIATLTPAKAFLAAKLEEEHGARVGAIWQLGGRFHPSPGLTPEAVFPFAVEIETERAAEDPLTWIRLTDALSLPLKDGHLRLVVLRAAHALELL